MHSLALVARGALLLGAALRRRQHLLAVTADPASEFWAVGDYDEGDWLLHPLAQHWDGRSWQTVDTPTAAEGALLSSVAACAGLVWADGWVLEPDD